VQGALKSPRTGDYTMNRTTLLIDFLAWAAVCVVFFLLWVITP
jgi:hypothetical protein